MSGSTQILNPQITIHVNWRNGGISTCILSSCAIAIALASLTFFGMSFSKTLSNSFPEFLRNGYVKFLWLESSTVLGIIGINSLYFCLSERAVTKKELVLSVQRQQHFQQTQALASQQTQALASQQSQVVSNDHHILTNVAKFLTGNECFNLSKVCRTYRVVCILMAPNIWYGKLFGTLAKEKYIKEERTSLVTKTMANTELWRKVVPEDLLIKQPRSIIDLFSSLIKVREKMTSEMLKEVIFQVCNDNSWNWGSYFMLMLDNNGKVRPEVDSPIRGTRHSLVSLCVRNQQISYVSFLLNHGANPNQVVGTGANAFSLLEIAIMTKTENHLIGKRNVEGSIVMVTRKKTEAMVEAFLACPGIEFDKRSKIDDYTPLTLACLSGYISIANLLIRKGADISAIPEKIRLRYLKETLSVTNDETLLNLLMTNNSKFAIYSRASTSMERDRT